MDDLVTWLRQQLDDDERDIIPVAGWQGGNSRLTTMQGTTVLMSARRAVADAEAKRRIMAIHSRRADVFPDDAGGTFDNCCHGCGYEGICDDPVTENINDCPVLRALALPYADRPGCREEWRPEVTGGQ